MNDATGRKVSEILKNAQSQTNNPMGQPVDVGMLILNSTSNLQASLNQIIMELSGVIYAIKKNYPALYELMQVGVIINEYVNRKIIAETYRSGLGTIDLKELATMDSEIDKVALQLVEKGSGYLEDAINQYEAYLKKKDADGS